MTYICTAEPSVSALQSKLQSPIQDLTQPFPLTADGQPSTPMADTPFRASPTANRITSSRIAHEPYNTLPLSHIDTAAAAESAQNTALSPLMDDVHLSSGAALPAHLQQSNSRSSSHDATPPASIKSPAHAVVLPDSFAAKSTSLSLLRRLRRSRVLALFMEERAVKEELVLPPPIHRLYRGLDQARRRSNQMRATAAAAVAQKREKSAPAPAAFGTATTTAASTTATARPPSVVAEAQGDVYSFTFTPRETAQLRAQQRTYLRQQRKSPYAPQLVRLDDVADALLHDSEMDGTATQEGYICDPVPPSTTQAEHITDLLSVFCTRAIPQEEYIDAVFQFRMSVLQRTCKAVPVGVVVPALVHPTVSLREAVQTQCCLPSGPNSNTKVKFSAKHSSHEKRNLPESTVTYPHPGTPYTFDDLARDPALLSAEQRMERRTALLHRRTRSEDLYGVPAPYM